MKIIQETGSQTAYPMSNYARLEYFGRKNHVRGRSLVTLGSFQENL